MRAHHVYKNVWTPSIGERLQLRRQDDYDDHAVSVAREGRDYSRHILELIMHGGSVGCEITGRRTLVRCEITRKRTLGKGGGGRINEGGRIHDTNSFDVEKKGGADKQWGAL